MAHTYILFLSCKKEQNAHKRMQILKPPPVLAVHLKRFEFYQLGNRIKKMGHVTFDHELDIAPFLVDATCVMKYELFSVFVHSGKSVYGGHYYTYVRSHGEESQQWFLMNDNAYILMYQMTPPTLDNHFKNTK